MKFVVFTTLLILSASFVEVNIDFILFYLFYFFNNFMFCFNSTGNNWCFLRFFLQFSINQNALAQNCEGRGERHNGRNPGQFGQGVRNGPQQNRRPPVFPPNHRGQPNSPPFIPRFPQQFQPAAGLATGNQGVQIPFNSPNVQTPNQPQIPVIATP